ncbi:hypothetical protein C5167_002991 [Papaver somniferum]|uniref:NADH:quinone oxidoreductase/Mrp antiporter transmembrane domain-containing protein n=1 Tax=Papaver somniferum TaxID=3469 RepID=A0A4Y7L0U3_PAPSO|nr:hypothetical protein C5167_002991 [Papaver somniferum]
MMKMRVVCVILGVLASLVCSVKSDYQGRIPYSGSFYLKSTELELRGQPNWQSNSDLQNLEGWMSVLRHWFDKPTYKIIVSWVQIPFPPVERKKSKLLLIKRSKKTLGKKVAWVAQMIGLHTWSPDAMGGPTLVSALIHATTTVTVGVFMIARCSPLFEYPHTTLIVITSAGATTSFLAATTGILQNDSKRVIAYSTCSKLGYMIFACGISNYSVSVFHLMNHTFFKALLFPSGGSVSHDMSDEKDMRKMGGIASSFPLNYAMMPMGSLSLIGFPFITGFYSKDVILELAYTKYTISGNFAFWLGSVSVLFNSYYSFHSIFLTFLVPTNSFGRDINRCHDAPIPMAIALILLAFGSLFVGYLAKV